MKKRKFLLAGVVGLMLVAGVGCSSNNSNNQENNDGAGEIHQTDFGVVDIPGELANVGNRVSVHDPSIEYDPETNQWYIFGSHTAFAQTSNLINWSYFEREGKSNSKYGKIFEEAGKWAANSGPGYKIEGNLWAPDVIYNKDMGKWCMYMSVNGSSNYSSIAMATADEITGPYTYEGTVVYSGFRDDEETALTDFEKVTGNTDIARYVNGNWSTYGTNAIDPCVLYDKNGQLWFVYGSWFGGLFMLKLDNETGLRDYSYTYELDEDATDGTASDPYLGYRVSGGYGGTGEGPYIVWDEEAGYYYMYVSYCGLNATDGFSGYQMRLFRSENIEGPYLDAVGNNALRVSRNDDQSVKGIKLMGNYCFSSLSGSDAASSGYMSPGHNSAIMDNEGNRFLIYHTRFNSGSEWHQLRVHQQFLNEDGWLVTAPYEYLGSKISETGYDKSEIVGSYEFINHGNEVTFNVVAGMLPTLEVTLNDDGTITGDVTGTWEQKTDSYYATMVIDGATYKGVFFKQYDESSSHTETMTFSLIGDNNLAIWGSKMGAPEAPETGNVVATYDFEDTTVLGKDTIGTVGDATVNGCGLVDDAERGNVLKFDGIDDFVQLPSEATDYTGYTFMLWFKATDIEMWQRVFDLGDNDGSYMFLSPMASTNKLRFAQTLHSDGEKMINGDSVALNKWIHVAVTVSKTSKKTTMYVNGEKIGSTVLSAWPEEYFGKSNYIGKSQFEADPYFNGYVDDVYIFDYALSKDEVISYMNK